MEDSSILSHLVLANEAIKEAQRHLSGAMAMEGDSNRGVSISDIHQDLGHARLRLQRCADDFASW